MMRMKIMRQFAPQACEKEQCACLKDVSGGWMAGISS